MSMETYTLRVAENEAHEGLAADVLDESGSIVETTRLSYDDYGLARKGSGESGPDPVECEVTADVIDTALQFERLDDGFEFRFLGDREEVASVRVSDAEWGLVAVAE
ncbi:hypothetical protein ACFO0N_18695 [Halobium salinum]|uniref:Uncharacterized protein n=1 Tax=Halobium salinum TaxID=1364940 RepID=A0ABD5PGF6_9EURY|nr:hypothetical protein [Halobium salinum]